MFIKRILISLCVAIVLSLGTMGFALAKGAEPPQPDYIPPELVVTPYGQTVSDSPWRAVWDVYIAGGQGKYCVRVIWGDKYPPYVSCSIYKEIHYRFVHDFDYPGTMNGTFYQTWKAYYGVGGPVYDYTYVIRR